MVEAFAVVTSEGTYKTTNRTTNHTVFIDYDIYNLVDRRDSMSPKEVKKTIRDYRFYYNEYEEINETLNKFGDDIFDVMGIGLSSKEEKLARRLEDLERRLMTVLNALEVTELNEREQSVVNWFMEGKKLGEIGKILNRSHTHTNRLLSSASQKMSDYINEVQTS